MTAGFIASREEEPAVIDRRYNWEAPDCFVTVH